MLYTINEDYIILIIFYKIIFQIYIIV